MPFPIPTLPALVERIKGDMNARMGNSNALIRRALAYVLAHVSAAAFWGIYQYQTWIADQVFADSAEGPQLARIARLFGIVTNPPSKADGSVSVRGIAGADLADAALMTRPDGHEYKVTGGPYHWYTTAVRPVTVQAVNAGTAENFEMTSDAALTLASPPAGVVANCPLASDIDGGTDVESDASLLERLLNRLADPPQGGAVADYEAWARATPTVPVDLVWVQVFEDMPLGQVKVVFTVVDTDDDGTVLPTVGPSSQATAVTDAITPKKPATALAYATAPAEHSTTVTLTVHPLPGVSPAEIATNVRRELQAMFRTRAAEEFSRAGWSIVNSLLVLAIDKAEGIDWFVLTDVDGGGGGGDVTLGANGYPVITDADVTINPV